ncbi:MAG: hypothetical protein AVDCRST_MAG13-1422 [uncultured Solirubrobacteraceae bacterium]|uniref:Uncharacterized protein n=1 Tax=uncultured Solirubrobacteraceae bacterium TaxID=1162706 RepID=A0A6J4S7Q0_9ACTN|nr:MAG: hypothetical protein AVDCRST_MAG13-1422 [uncultured Solirubrobacteraceae bacterium]
MHVVPAQALEREGVEGELARVEEAVELHPPEVRRAQRPELLGAVLLEVPGIARLLRALGGEGQDVRRGEHHEAARPREGLEALEHLVGVAHVLDRLQEDDRVGGRVVALDHVPDEREVRAHVAQPRVLVGLRIGVHADHVAGGAGQDVGAVALPAGHVDHPQPADLPGDPLVDDEVPAEPVVLLGHVGQRALAGEGERRHPVGLVALEEEALGVRGHPAGTVARVPRTPRAAGPGMATSSASSGSVTRNAVRRSTSALTAARAAGALSTAAPEASAPSETACPGASPGVPTRSVRVTG